MTIATILNQKGRDVFKTDPATTLVEVVKMLRDKGVGAILVAEGEKLCGILSERDIVRALSNHGGSALLRPASEFMTKDVMTCTEDETIVSVMSRMTTGRFRHMPVVKGRKIAGLVSIGDVVKFRIEETEREAEDMRAYIAAG
ncbi:CBS domain-containing protein [Cohaesibacter haloalkalitolerans]|jgi:CBS domain-containing protein|uniref:CBS domain-containing protein n=1 Tax=Cohaesibacter haloalkalitolerans TaxID=1162980 RepID=UPI000E64AD80|nr:CBS domain-containing protein [Cohaesibacter haloalkalitolerans]